MRATYTLSPFPDGSDLIRLQTRLESLRGVRSAVLEPQGGTAHVDFDPPVVTDAAIEGTIRACGVAITAMTTAPDEVLDAAPAGRAIDDRLTNPEGAMARMVQDAEVRPATPGGSLMPETGEATRAAFPGHSL